MSPEKDNAHIQCARKPDLVSAARAKGRSCPTAILLAVTCLFATALYLFSPSLPMGSLFWCGPIALIAISIPHSLRCGSAIKTLAPLWVWSLAAFFFLAFMALINQDTVEILQRIMELVLFMMIVSTGYQAAKESIGLHKICYTIAFLCFLAALLIRYRPLARAVIVNPNALGMLCCIAVIFIVLTAGKGKLPLIALGLAVSTTIISRSRTSLAALAIALVSFIILHRIRGRSFRLLYLILLAAPVIATFAIALSPNLMPDSSINIALTGRPLIWQFALSKSTWLGNGPGTWRHFVACAYDYKVLPWSEITHLLDSGGGFHNMYVQIFFALGLGGLLFTLSLLFIVTTQFDPDGKRKVFPAFIFMAFFGMAEETFTPLISYSWPCILLWLLIGYLLGKSDMEHENPIFESDGRT